MSAVHNTTFSVRLFARLFLQEPRLFLEMLSDKMPATGYNQRSMVFPI